MAATAATTMAMAADRAAVAGVLLAGGKARRMGGGDKGLKMLAGRPILDHIVERVRPQVDALVLNANPTGAADAANTTDAATGDGTTTDAASTTTDAATGDIGDADERFAAYGLALVADSRDGIEGFAGPLAGVLAGLEWAARAAPDCAWVASFPTDAPFLPRDLVARLMAAVEGEGADMGCAASGGRHHPVVGLWPVALAGELRQALVTDGVRKVDLWTGRYRLAVAEFGTDPVDPFFNANRADDLREAERLLRLERA